MNRSGKAWGYAQAAQHVFAQESTNDFHYTNHLHNGDLDDDAELDGVMPRVAHSVMVQLSLKQGLRQFGD